MRRTLFSIVLVFATAGCSTLASTFRSGGSGPRAAREPEGKLEVAAVPRADVLHVAVEFVPAPHRGSLLQRLARELGDLERKHEVLGSLDPVSSVSVQRGLDKLAEDPQGALGPLAHFLPDAPGIITPDRPVPTMKRFPRVARVHVEGAGLVADGWTDTSGRARFPLGPFAASTLASGADVARLVVESEAQRVELPFSLDDLATIVAWSAAEARLPTHGLEGVAPTVVFWSRVLAAGPSPRLSEEAHRRLAGAVPLDAASVALIVGARETAALPDGAFVDWRPGPARGNPRFTYALDVRPEPLSGGDELLLAVTNPGTSEVHQVYARLTGDVEATLLIGRLGPRDAVVRRLLAPRARDVRVELRATDDRRVRATEPD